VRWSWKGCVGRFSTLPLAHGRRQIRRIDFGFHGKPFVLKCLYIPTDKSRVTTEALAKGTAIPYFDNAVAS
jgi:hypothetical protein